MTIEAANGTQIQEMSIKYRSGFWVTEKAGAKRHQLNNPANIPTKIFI